ncbi:hypothetical protein KP509_03G047300 [Ceratopteris richardii]|uniref:Uncharacterized protein n=1 Tax=Ceratopteris richardii TaxID=49495 RepID=A0A8T2V386_CERRI|nr:hypothetical protein KP509_03G047300 [Ceratopteris richardii]
MAEALDPLDMPIREGSSDADSAVVTSSSSFSSAPSSSDIDTRSTASISRRRTTTLASLIGITGDAGSANGDPVPTLIQGAPPGDGSAPMHVLIRNATSEDQGPCFAQTARIRSGAIKLRNFWACGACKGLCYSNRGRCGVFCCSKKGNCDVHSPEPAIGDFLVTERHAERSVNNGFDADSNDGAARVYLNIIFEENSGIEQPAMNPLFDIDSANDRVMGGLGSSVQITECSLNASQNRSSEQAGKPDNLISSSIRT